MSFLDSLCNVSVIAVLLVVVVFVNVFCLIFKSLGKFNFNLNFELSGKHNIGEDKLFLYFSSWKNIHPSTPQPQTRRLHYTERKRCFMPSSFGRFVASFVRPLLYQSISSLSSPVSFYVDFRPAHRCGRRCE